MLSKIQTIFASSNFEPHHITDGILYQYNQSADNTPLKESFWLVVEKDLPQILSEQGSYFSNSKQLFSGKAFNKNCNLLILYKTSGQTLNSVDQKMIQQIEEDPYIFRKYVLYYTDEEVSELDKILNGQEIDYFLNINISNPDIFSRFKSDTRDLNGYSLLYRTITKLPYITIQCGETKSLHTINNRIDEIITKRNLSSLHTKLLEKISDLDEELIKTLDSIQIIELINSDRGDSI